MLPGEERDGGGGGAASSSRLRQKTKGQNFLRHSEIHSYCVEAALTNIWGLILWFHRRAVPPLWRQVAPLTNTTTCVWMALHVCLWTGWREPNWLTQQKKQKKILMNCSVRGEQLVSGKNVGGERCVAVTWGEFWWEGAGQTVLNQPSRVKVRGSGCDSACYKSKNHESDSKAKTLEREIK